MSLLRAIGFVVLAITLGCVPRGSADGRILVFAAASLGEAFKEIAARFEAGHPDLAVDLHLAGTSRLAFQISEGAPADVFASADADNMDRVVGCGAVVDGPHVFAQNELAIVVRRGNPRQVEGLADFARGDLRLALCGPEVPAGRYARQALSRAGVEARPVSDEPHVKAVVAKVGLGEVDAGLVYRTDVTAAGDGVERVDLPDAQQVAAVYPIAALGAGDARPTAARAFVDFVLGAEGRAVLTERGFLLP